LSDTTMPLDDRYPNLVSDQETGRSPAEITQAVAEGRARSAARPGVPRPPVDALLARCATKWGELAVQRAKRLAQDPAVPREEPHQVFDNMLSAAQHTALALLGGTFAGVLAFGRPKERGLSLSSMVRSAVGGPAVGLACAAAVGYYHGPGLVSELRQALAEDTAVSDVVCPVARTAFQPCLDDAECVRALEEKPEMHCVLYGACASRARSLGLPSLYLPAAEYDREREFQPPADLSVR
jgi:hypothetical protein